MTLQNGSGTHLERQVERHNAFQETLLLTLDALLDVRCGYALRGIGGSRGEGGMAVGV